MRTVKALSSGLPPVFPITASSVTRAVHSRVIAAYVNTGGSGYKVGDVLTVNPSGATQVTASTLAVTRVASDGAVMEVVVAAGGDFTGTLTTPNSCTGGTGTSVSIAITTYSYALVTATVASGRPHRLTSGMRVGVTIDSSETAALQRLYAGIFVVTVSSATVFTYEHTDTATATLASVASFVAQALLPSTSYDPFAVIRNNRLQTEESVPDYTLYVVDTVAHAGNWREILALENTVVAALTSTTLSGFAAAMKIPAGARVKGVFSSITLTSGSVLLSE